MEPARTRSGTILNQRVHDIAERLSTHAKAGIYEVLEGIASAGELSLVMRLEPLINDIVSQVNDSFKQALTKRLLPEASKLLGQRVTQTQAWPTGQASPAPASPVAISRHQSPPIHDSELLAMALAPGSGNPLRTEHGPPDAASAQGSSLVIGSATASSPLSHTVATPASASTSANADGSSSLLIFPQESRFAFANSTSDTQRAQALSNSAGDGGCSDSLGDPLPFLGLTDGSSALGLVGAQDAGSGATSTPNNANGSDLFLRGGRSTPNGLGGFSILNSPSTHSSTGSSRPFTGQIALPGMIGGGTPIGALGGPVRNLASNSSPAHTGATSPSYASLSLAAIRPGSSLDPGLAIPPLSLSGTEPLRGAVLSTPGGTPVSRISATGEASPLTPLGNTTGSSAPVPLFGGAPGPGGNGGHLHRQHHMGSLNQQQPFSLSLAEQQQYTTSMSGEISGLLSSVGLANGNMGNGNNIGGDGMNGSGSPALLSPSQHQHFLQQQQQQYDLLQQHQQLLLQSQQHAEAGGTGLLGGQGGGAQQPLSTSFRMALTAAPEGPRNAHDDSLFTQQQLQLHFQSLGDSQYGAQDLYGAQDMQYTQQQLMYMDRYQGSASGVGHGVVIRRGPLTSPGMNLDPASPFYGSSYGLGSPAAAFVGGAMGSAIGGGFGALGGGGQVAVVRQTGPPLSPTMAAATMVTTPSPGPGGRSSRSGAASADSRSSSFSAAGPRRNSAGGAGGSTTPPPALTPHLQPSPPASDASGPASSTASTGGRIAGAKSPVLMVAMEPGAVGMAAGCGSAVSSMASKLQQVSMKTVSGASVVTSPRDSGQGRGKGSSTSGAVGGAQSPTAVPPNPAIGGSGSSGSGCRAPADMPGRFRCLPQSVQARIATLTRDNHVVLLKDFDEKVLSKMTLLVDKFGAAECLAMLDRIEEVLKGKAGRLANGPGYLDVSVSTRLDELKQRASGQVTAPEDYARSTLHSRIYGELRDLIARHGFLQWHHFDQGIINMLKKMPNATATERLNELAYHSFKNVDNPKSCIVSIFTTKPKYVNA